MRWTFLIVISSTAWLMASANLSMAEQTTRRMLFLGPKAPKILEVTLNSGRFSIEETRNKYAESAFGQLDRDKDGVLNQQEAIQVPENGRLLAGGATVGDRWKKLDNNADEEISPEEFAEYVNLQFGPILSIQQAAPRLTETVRLYSDLDLNGDESIDAEELANGLNALRRFDFDDDKTLSVAELQPFPLSVVQSLQAQRAEREPLPLLFIEKELETEEAAKRCVRQYGDGKTLSEKTMVELAGRQARRFDLNRDRTYTSDEVEACLKNLPADYELNVSIAPPQISVAGTRPQRKLDMDLGGVPVVMQAVYTGWQQVQNVKLLKIRFLMSDNDRNKYLDRAEFNGLQSQAAFEAVDLDGNEQVTTDEIEAYFSLDALASQSRIIVSISNETQTLFDILDVDNDNRLDPREFLSGHQRLLEHDLNQDQSLRRDEFVSTVGMTFTQPELFQTDPRRDANAAQNNRQGITQEPLSGPLWFRRMDHNIDGEITWREFLGSREDFDAIDLNVDGFVDEQEATQADAQRP